MYKINKHIKKKPQVNLRYFGSKCTKTNIKSTVSPDGSYILSGSEEGIPHIWSLDSGLPKIHKNLNVVLLILFVMLVGVILII